MTTTIDTIPLEALSATRDRVREVNEANGWFEKDRTLGEGMALLVSELSEALDAYRDWQFEDRTRVACTHRQFQADYDRHDASFAARQHICKPEGVGSELADVVIRLLDETDRQGVPLDAMVRATVRFNDEESFGDAIMETIVQASLGYVAFTEHTAAAIYSHVLGLAVRAGVDLPDEVDRKLAFNATRGYRHGNRVL